LKDYYSILGVSQNASQDEIKKAFREKAKEHHPDISIKDENEEDLFKTIGEAYSVLSDEEKRKTYETSRAIFASGGGFRGATDLRWMHFSRENQSRINPDVKIAIQISLEEAFSGSDRQIRYDRFIFCAKCDGKGYPRSPDFTMCKKCDGRGVLPSMASFFGIVSACQACRGKGKILKNPCKSCNGAKIVAEKKTISLTIPKGAKSNLGIRSSGFGNEYEKGLFGNLITFLKIKPHDLFQLQRNNIVMSMPVPLHMFYGGGDVEIPTLHGAETVHVGRNKLDKNRRAVLKGKGFRDLRTDNFGDHIVNFVVELPQKIPTEVMSAIKTMSDSSEFYPDYNRIREYRMKK